MVLLNNLTRFPNTKHILRSARPGQVFKLKVRKTESGVSLTTLLKLEFSGDGICLHDFESELSAKIVSIVTQAVPKEAKAMTTEFVHCSKYVLVSSVKEPV